MPVFIYPPTKGHLGSFQVWQLGRKMFLYTSGAGFCVHVDFQLLWLNNKEWHCWIVITFGFVRHHQTVPFCTSTISEWSSCCPKALVFLLLPYIMHCSRPADGCAFTEWLGTRVCCFRSRVSKHLKQESPSPAPCGFGALWKAASHQRLAKALGPHALSPHALFLFKFYLFICGCAGSSLLHTDFLYLRWVAAVPSLCVGFSLW